MCFPPLGANALSNQVSFHHLEAVLPQSVRGQVVPDKASEAVHVELEGLVREALQSLQVGVVTAPLEPDERLQHQVLQDHVLRQYIRRLTVLLLADTTINNVF